LVLNIEQKSKLPQIKNAANCVKANDDQKAGVDIVRKALSWPARQIAINSESFHATPAK
jgi:hypothetical protein